MTKEKLKELQFVILAGVLGTIALLGCIIAEFNVVDMLYLIFLVGCAIRYIYICRKN